MKYVYPAIFSVENEKILVSIPDLPGCHTFGDNLLDAIEMARDSICMWLCVAEDNQETIPVPTQLENVHPGGGFVNLVDADTSEYRRVNDSRAIKKTLSIPSWLNSKAEISGINFSQVLQDALKEKLHIS